MGDGGAGFGGVGSGAGGAGAGWGDGWGGIGGVLIPNRGRSVMSVSSVVNDIRGNIVSQVVNSVIVAGAGLAGRAAAEGLAMKSAPGRRIRMDSGLGF
jgi:hypothetical protein